jgi:hypothetical protein
VVVAAYSSSSLVRLTYSNTDHGTIDDEGARVVAVGVAGAGAGHCLYGSMAMATSPMMTMERQV